MLLGVLFDIDGLEGGLYGYKAYKALFAAVDLRDLAGCALSDGDTRATLAGQKNEYCIAIASSSAAQLARVREALTRSNAPGLLPPAARFITDAAVAREPLVLAAQVTPGGELVQYTGWVRAAWEKCCAACTAGTAAPFASAAAAAQAVAESGAAAQPSAISPDTASAAAVSRKWWRFWKS